METYDKVDNMNIAICLVLVIVSNTNCYVSEKTSSIVQEQDENGVFLKILQSSIRNDSDKGTTSLTWSEILADVLVRGTKLFSPYNSSPINETLQEFPRDDAGKANNIIARFCSQVLDIYKILVYDKLFRRSPSEKNLDVEKPETLEFVNELSEIETITNAAKEDFGVITINPDVEIIEPKYHGRLCDGCDEKNIEKKDGIPANDNCPEGLKKDANGNCGDPKSSNFILSVPFHCPLGYKADWFGICRMRF